MLDTVNQFGVSLLGATLWAVVWNLIKIVALLLPLMGCVAYLTLWERKSTARKANTATRHTSVR